MCCAVNTSNKTSPQHARCAHPFRPARSGRLGVGGIDEVTRLSVLILVRTSLRYSCPPSQSPSPLPPPAHSTIFPQIDKTHTPISSRLSGQNLHATHPAHAVADANDASPSSNASHWVRVVGVSAPRCHAPGRWYGILSVLPIPRSQFRISRAFLAPNSVCKVASLRPLVYTTDHHTAHRAVFTRQGRAYSPTTPRSFTSRDLSASTTCHELDMTRHEWRIDDGAKMRRAN